MRLLELLVGKARAQVDVAEPFLARFRLYERKKSTVQGRLRLIEAWAAEEVAWSPAHLEWSVLCLWGHRVQLSNDSKGAASGTGARALQPMIPTFKSYNVRLFEEEIRRHSSMT